MAHTYANLLAHVVFSTKHRDGIITPEIEPRLHAYIGAVLRDKDAALLAVGGMPDHIHLLIQHPPRIAAADLVGAAKANSSRWIRETFDVAFAWQVGYAILSVSESAVPNVKRYLQSQREHHRRISYQEEYLMFLKKNRIPHDPETMWD